MRASAVIVAIALVVLQMQCAFAVDHNAGQLTSGQSGLQGVGTWVKCMSGVVSSTVDDVSAILSRCAEEVGLFNECLLLGGIELVQDVVVAAIKCTKA